MCDIQKEIAESFCDACKEVLDAVSWKVYILSVQLAKSSCCWKNTYSINKRN